MPEQPSDRRRHPRLPIALRVRVAARTEAEFASRYATNLSRGGIFLRTKASYPVGTRLQLDLQLADGTAMIRANGEVRYVTDGDEPGMGIQFHGVDEASQIVIDRLCGVERTIPMVSRGPAAPPALERVQLDLPGARPGFVPADGGPVIGIDLGNTCARAAWARGGAALVLPMRDAQTCVPALVALNARGELVSGARAAGQMQASPRTTIVGARRLLGTRYDAPLARECRERFHYEMVAGPAGEAGVRMGGAPLTAEQIAALVLAEVREGAQNALGEPVSRAVIALPAGVDEAGRAAVREAARLAGLRVERLIGEAEAAALAHGLTRNGRVLVYDLGGSSFSATVLAVRAGATEVVAAAGDPFLGGADLDEAVAEFLFERFEARLGRPFAGDPMAMQRIVDAAQRARCVLSDETSVRVHVPFVATVDGTPLDLDEELGREQLETLCLPILERTLASAADVVARSGGVDEVVLAGGLGRMPRVRRLLGERLGVEVRSNVPPDLSVALGAALLGPRS